MTDLKKVIISLVFICNAIVAFAIEQIPDLVIYRGDTLYISGAFDEDFPLYKVFKNKKYKSKMRLKKTCEASACNRGYQAIWKIEKGKIFLSEIRDYCTKRPLDLYRIFEKKLRKGIGVQAFWLSQTINLSSEPFGVENLEKEMIFVEFKVKKGRLLVYDVGALLD